MIPPAAQAPIGAPRLRIPLAWRALGPGPAAAPAARAVTTQPPWKLYEETTATSAIDDAVNGAAQVVNAELFGFTDAGKGARLTTALEQAASRGVEVNVITDFVPVVGTTDFVGGMNFIKLGDDYRDSMVRLSGVHAARLAAEHLDRWGRVGGTVTDRHHGSVGRALAGQPLAD